MARQVSFSKMWLTSTGVLLVFTVLVSIVILILFRIENWGGAPNLAEQTRMKLIGIVVLIPIGTLYAGCGWSFAKITFRDRNSMRWLLAFGITTLGLCLWNSNFAWHNPATNPSGIVQGILDLLSIVPLMVFVLLLLANGYRSVAAQARLDDIPQNGRVGIVSGGGGGILAKSIMGAVIMLVIIALSMWVTASLLPGAPGIKFQSQDIVTIVVGINVALLMIYSCDESHFGLEGAVRWAVFGVVSVLLVQLQSTILPQVQSWQSSLSIPLLRHLFDLVVTSLLEDGILSLIVSYSLVFILVPPASKWRKEEGG